MLYESMIEIPEETQSQQPNTAMCSIGIVINITTKLKHSCTETIADHIFKSTYGIYSSNVTYYNYSVRIFEVRSLQCPFLEKLKFGHFHGIIVRVPIVVGWVLWFTVYLY